MKTKEYIVTIANVKLICKHCGCDCFRWREGLLDTRAMTFFGLEFFNKSSHLFICCRCGFVHTFSSSKEIMMQEFIMQSPEEFKDNLAAPSECIECNGPIPIGLDHCPKCGWTYKQ